MQKLAFFFLLAIFSCQPDSGSAGEASANSSSSEPEASPMPEHQQLLVVTTPGWNAYQGTLQRFEWTDNNWQPIGERIDIVVGKKGMGWGIGVEDFTANEGPVKKEGDLKSPAGIFRLGAAFGYASATEVSWAKTPYIHVSTSTMCIEDRSSAYYNQIIDEKETQADWNSTDHMLRKDDLYEWGMFVEHNSPDARPGSGSCIFLHVAEIDDDGTAGCTAMAKPLMLNVLQWVNARKKPLLAQMPEGEYERFRREYKLPELQ